MSNQANTSPSGYGLPACKIPAAQPSFATKASNFPPVPVANDLASALAAINAMRQILFQLLNMLNSQNNLGNGYGPGSPFAGTSNPGSRGQNPNFVEVPGSRSVEKVTITDPVSGASVTFNQITGVTFKDAASGQTLTWGQ